MEAVRAGETLLRHVGDDLGVGKLLCVRGRVEAASGDKDLARKTLTEAEALAATVGSGPDSELCREIALNSAQRSRSPCPAMQGRWSRAAIHRLPVRVVQELLRAHADRGAGRTRAHARRPARQVLAHVALHRLLGLVLARPAAARVPARAVRPVSSHDSRLGGQRFGSTGAIWITPYGQLRSQLPQPMQVSSMKTSPCALRWIASGGQSFMQCGFSQCRHEVGTWMFANVGPAWRSRRDVPSCESAHAFSQLSQRMHRLSSISSTSVASPRPWLEQEADQVARRRAPLRAATLLLRRSSIGASQLVAQRRVAVQHLLETCRLQHDRLGLHRGAHRRRAALVGQQRHFADVVARGEVREHDVLAADLLRDRHRAAADEMQAVGLVAFA